MQSKFGKNFRATDVSFSNGVLADSVLRALSLASVIRGYLYVADNAAAVKHSHAFTGIVLVVLVLARRCSEPEEAM